MSNWGVDRDRGVKMVSSYLSPRSVLKPECEKESDGEESGAGYSKRDGKDTGVVALHKMF